MTDQIDNILDTNSPAVVMVVDDEEMVTTTLSTYLQFETDYDVLTFQSPEKALQQLRNKPVDLIISDFLMPGMDGLQFLGEASKLYPNAARILLTGYADKENAIKAINEVGLYQYIEKPWDNDRLKLVIRNALSHKNLREILNKKVRELDRVLLERDKLFEHNELINTELKLAKNVQESLLPQCIPEIDGFSLVARYQPALEIGGDFYDVLPLAEGKYGILIADVTGHGIQAALITVLLKAAFADFKQQRVSPGEILNFMNKTLFSVLPQTIYVAAMVAILNPENASCQIVNAGVPHPFLVKNGETQRVPASGLLLGVADEDSYLTGDEIHLTFEKGDKFILYTDGLSEVENNQGIHFDEQIHHFLENNQKEKSAELLDKVIAAAEAYSKKDHQWDDVTGIIIERC